MKYKFVKYKTTIGGHTTTSNWMFEPRSKEQIYEFTETYTLSKMRDENQRLVHNLFYASKKSAEGNPNYNLDDPKNRERIWYGGHPASAWQSCHNSLYLAKTLCGDSVNVIDLNTNIINFCIPMFAAIPHNITNFI